MELNESILGFQKFLYFALDFVQVDPRAHVVAISCSIRMGEK